jgi:hypothetical protein
MKNATSLLFFAFITGAFAVDEFKTAVVTTSSNPLGFSVDVKEHQFLRIYNFTQDNGGNVVSERGKVVAAAATPTATSTPIATPTPTLSTNAGPPVALSTGDKLTDTATLFGDNNPTGTLTFALRDPSNALVDTETVMVTGNGSYNTPTGFSPTVTGTYTWSASYSGDVNNSPATDSGQNETEIVTATPTPTPSPTPPPRAILTASIVDSGVLPEPIKQIVIDGPAHVTVQPVSDATLVLSYMKVAEPTPTPTPAPIVVTTVTPTPSPTP